MVPLVKKYNCSSLRHFFIGQFKLAEAESPNVVHWFMAKTLLLIISLLVFLMVFESVSESCVSFGLVSFALSEIT